MLADIIVKSNFPDVLSCNVEYTVSFQILMVEKRTSSIKFEFSKSEIVKRITKTQDDGDFLYYDDSISFVLNGVGVYTFSIVLGETVIYKKEFILEELIESTFYKKQEQKPLCLKTPKNVLVTQDKNTFSFTCSNSVFEEWLVYHHTQEVKKNNNNVYCGIRYFAPERSTHWRIKTSSAKGNTQDSGFTEFTNSDGNMVDWYFPIAELVDERANILENTYHQSIGFYVQCGNEFVELDYNEYSINILYSKNTKSLNTIWNDEILRLVSFIKEGYQTKDLIRKYGVWHSLSEEIILSDIRRYKDNFGEFALNKGLIETSNQAILLNYATHYTLIDSIIKLGITDLKQTREDFQDLMLQANKGIGDVLPQIN